MIGGILMVDVQSSVHSQACSHWHTQVAIAVAMIRCLRTRSEDCADSDRWEKKLRSSHLILFVIKALAPVMQLLVALRHARPSCQLASGSHISKTSSGLLGPSVPAGRGKRAGSQEAFPLLEGMALTCRRAARRANAF